MGMKKDEGREFVIKAERVVYIYHNRIDAIGEKRGKTEGRHLRGGAQGHRRTGRSGPLHHQQPQRQLRRGHRRPRLSVHGTPPGETDKSKLEGQAAGTVKAKKRYLIGHNLSENDEGLARIDRGDGRCRGRHGVLDSQGANRFHFVGGARFVHGGAMPQEIVVPVVRVQHVKGKKGEEDQDQAGDGVSVLGSNTRSPRPAPVPADPDGSRSATG